MLARVARLLVVFGLLLPVAACGSSPSLGVSFDPRPQMHEVAPQANPEDPDDISRPDSRTWVLHFRFKALETIVVDIPRRALPKDYIATQLVVSTGHPLPRLFWCSDYHWGKPPLLERKTLWYMWYQVINKTNESHLFIPYFVLVTQDNNTVHHDEILPRADDAIKLVEDPGGSDDMKNSVTISNKPILPAALPKNYSAAQLAVFKNSPVTRLLWCADYFSAKPILPAKPVTGVAIWDELNPDVDHFSVLVIGLSNGAGADGPNYAWRGAGVCPQDTTAGIPARVRENTGDRATTVDLPGRKVSEQAGRRAMVAAKSSALRHSCSQSLCHLMTKLTCWGRLCSAPDLPGYPHFWQTVPSHWAG